MKHAIWLLAALLLTACGGTATPAVATTATRVEVTLPNATETVIATPFIPEFPTETASPSPTPDGTYTVQPGDTLIKIAEIYGIPYGYLADQNGITDPNLINTGQVLVIPVWPPLPDTGGEKLIVVMISEQKVYVYEGGNLIKTFIVSTGTSDHPTVTGKYNIYVKLKKDHMVGPGYDLPDVPWVMYFFEGYSFHGTYWHSNFGYPMSHGCVNMYTPDALWLFNWANVGTEVQIYP